MAPPVWAIVVNWNSTSDAQECLAALRRSTYPDLSVVLVDNASTDNGVARLRAADPQAVVIENDANLGYAEGNNVGLRYALAHGAHYALLVNPDACLPPEAIGQLVAVGEQAPENGIVGPVVVSYFDHTQQYLAVIDWATGQAGERPIQPPTAGGTQAVDYVTGCALLIKASAIERIGLLDPEYFAYYEDADWCLRGRQAGFQVLVSLAAQVYHKGTPDAVRAPSAAQWYYYTRNQRLFVRRHAPRRRQLVLWLRYIRTTLQAARAARQAHDPLKATAILDGWWAGLTGHFGAERRQLAPSGQAAALRLAPAIIGAISLAEAAAKR